MTASEERYLVLRVPASGPKALIAPPNDFADETEAQARIDAVEACQLQPHHTYLEIFCYKGDRFEAMRKAGIIY